MQDRSRYFLIAITLLIFGNYVLRGQVVENGEDKTGAWYMYFGTNRISGKISLHTEVQLRLYELTDNFNQLLLRTGINYHIDEDAIATVGYGFIKSDGTFTEFPGAIDLREHRLFEQFILKNSLGKIGFEHRYRLEQRFLDFGNDRETAHRARYRIQCTVPVSRVVFLNFYDEIFLNLQGEVFGQNRAYAALGLWLAPNTSIQVGYLKNHFSTEHFDRLQLGIFYNFDFRRNKTGTIEEATR
jgi:hypothetical protein